MYNCHQNVVLSSKLFVTQMSFRHPSVFLLPKMSSIIVQNVDAQAAVLDGEMIVWDNLSKSMAPFGLNKNVAK